MFLVPLFVPCHRWHGYTSCPGVMVSLLNLALGAALP